MDSDESEICRVCRCEATESEPLFYPCRCSGSIRYVHQACLSQWLAHSRKSYCELCKHPFSFTPIYAKDMPEILPVHVILYRGTLSISRGLFFISRCCLTGLFWLVGLPYLVLGTFRLMINLTDKGAAILAFGFLPSGSEALMGAPDSVESYYIYLRHLESLNSQVEAADAFYGWSDFWSDCFKGQIITVVVVSIFLILFLLREWAFHAFPQLNTGAPLPGENPVERLAPEAPAVPIPPIRNLDAFINLPRLIMPVRLTELEQAEYYRERNHRLRLRGFLARQRSSLDRQALAPTLQTPMPLIVTSQNEQLSDAERLKLAYFENSLAELDPDGWPANSPAKHESLELSQRRLNGVNASTSTDQAGPSLDGSSARMDSTREGSERRSASDSGSESPPVNPRFSFRSPTPPRPRSPSDQEPLAPAYYLEENVEPDLTRRASSTTDGAEDQVQDQPPAPILPLQAEGEAQAEAEAAPVDPPAIEGEELFGEEMNGIAEFIGLRGDPLLLFQYAMMIYVLVAAGLWGFIGLPLLIGRFMLLLELSTLVAFPVIWARYLLGVVRLFTDPLTHFFLHSVLGRFMEVSASNSPSILDLARDRFTTAATRMVWFLDQLGSSGPSPTIGPQYSWVWALYDRVDALRLLVATSGSVGHRIVTVGIGYLLVSLGYVGCISFGELTNPELLSIRRILYVMTKIAVFIILEILVFPFLCGLLLDYVTLPLFAGATVASRVQLFAYAPLGMTFLHWVSGTGFFFLFSVFMTQCRRASRRGLLWFIRDPNEANPQPVREMVSRSVKDQMYRLGVSAVVYALIIFGGVGLVVYSGLLLPGKVLPLRLASSRPYHEVSFDLVVLELLIPALVARFQPQQLLKLQFVRVWRGIAAFYRLTNFITGQRVIVEEYSALPRTWLACCRIHRPLSCPDYLFVADGSYRRTPNSDTVTIVPGRRMVVLCHRDGRPLDPLDVPADSPIYPNANVCIAYAPPNFGLRVAAFVLTVSLVCDVVGWFALYGPLLVGRFAIAVLVPTWSPVSDLYSYNLGFVMLWIAGASAVRCYAELRSAWDAFLFGYAYAYAAQVLGGMLKLMKQAYLVFGMWGITPLMIALFVDMYIHTPLRAPTSPTMLSSPHRLSYMWSIGATILLLAQRYAGRHPNSWLAQSMPSMLVLDDLSAPQPKEFSVSFLAPMLGAALLLYFGPLAAASFVSARLYIPTPVVLQWYTSGCLYIMLGWLLAKGSDRHFQRWRHSIRDDEYLIGQALNNIHPRPAMAGR